MKEMTGCSRRTPFASVGNYTLRNAANAWSHGLTAGQSSRFLPADIQQSAHIAGEAWIPPPP
jgi:hypothetical protein